MKKPHLLFFISCMAAAFLLFFLLTFNSRESGESRIDRPLPVIFKTTQPVSFWNVVLQGMHEAAREFGVGIQVSGPEHERQIDLQVEILNQLIEEEPPLIILAASDYNRLAESVQAAADRGIPVITLDSGVNSEHPVSFVATDNVQAGRQAGQAMSDLLSEPADNSVAIVSHLRETATAIEREEGVRQILNNATILGTWYCRNDEELAYENTLQILSDQSVTGIVALNEVVTLGAARAVRDKNEADRVAVVGFDNAPGELALLEQGYLNATVVQRPYNMGYIAVKTAVEYLDGQDVPSRINTGSVLITADNMFQRGYQELLFPVNDD